MKKGILIAGLATLLLSCNSDNKNSEEQMQDDLAAYLEQDSIKEEEPVKPIGTGKIETFVDGSDVQRVNLWSTTGSDRSMTAYLTDGEEVKILEDADPYFLVESKKNSLNKGYCLKGFIIVDK